MISKFALQSALALSFLFLVSACDNNDDVDRFLEANDVSQLQLNSLQLTADRSLVNRGESVQFHVTANAESTSVDDLDSRVTWHSSDTSLASVSTSGLVNALADGEVTIRVDYAHLSASKGLTINTADLQSIDIITATEMDECASLTLSTIGNFSDGSQRPLADGTTWSLSDTELASITANSNSAELYAHNSGSVEVSVSQGAISSTVEIAILDTLQSLTLSPLNASLSVGRKQTYKAAGVFSHGATQDVTVASKWTAIDPAIATFEGRNSVLTAKLAGNTTVVSDCGGISASTGVNVTSLTLDSVEINNNRSSITLDTNDDGYELVLRAVYSDGTEIDVTEDAEWDNITNANGNIIVSDDEDSKGELSISGTGSANIEATYEGKSDTILIIVE